MTMVPRTFVTSFKVEDKNNPIEDNNGERCWECNKNDVNHLLSLIQQYWHCKRRSRQHLSVLHKADNNNSNSHFEQQQQQQNRQQIKTQVAAASSSSAPLKLPAAVAVDNKLSTNRQKAAVMNKKKDAQQRRRTLFLLVTLTFTAIGTQFSFGGGVCAATMTTTSSLGNVNSNFHLQTSSSSSTLLPPPPSLPYQTQPLLSGNITLAPRAAALGGGGSFSTGIVAASSILDFSPNCSAVVHVFETRGIPLVEIPQKPSNEIVLRYCESSSVGTCCTYSMETKMAMSSRMQLEKQSKEQIAKLSSIFSSRAQKFNEIFNQLLAESKREFHAMFKRTYGVIYEQNAYVFSDLFNELEKYYSRGRVDLAEAMDSFFNILYQKMFTVLNAQYSFDDKYLGCVSEHMKELKPFGDVPDKLSVQIKRSFVATRTFAQALMTAADVTKKVVNIRLNADCTAALTKMQHCGACKGYAEKPCVNYCVNVVKGCLHHFHELDTEWDNYVLAMEKVAERLLGSFNIVMVVEPINIKISEAIMNFQESGQDISNRVFQGCGRPSLGRRRRSAINSKFFETSKIIKKQISPMEINDFIDADDILDIDAKLENEIVFREKRSADPGPKDMKSSNVGNSGGNGNRRNRKKQQNKKNEDKDYSSREPILDKQIKEIRQKVKESKKFWSNLPHQFCNNEEISATSVADNNCWNGHTVDRYMHSITTEHGSNPEFPGNPTSTRQSSAIATQLYYLKIAINHLRNAYNGLDVDWTDQEDPYYGSGSGSGGGSDDEDDDEGSGINGPFPPSHKSGGSSTGAGVGGGISGGLPDKTDHPAVRVNNIDDEDDADTTHIMHTSSGPKHGSSGSSNTSGKKTKEDIDDDEDENDVDENRITRKKSKEHSKGSGGTKTSPPMTLRRALFLYLVPLYVAWFGGIVSDLL